MEHVGAVAASKPPARKLSWQPMVKPREPNPNKPWESALAGGSANVTQKRKRVR